MKKFVKHGIAIIGIAALVFLAVGSTSSTPSPLANKEFTAMFNKGTDSYSKGNYNQAIAEFTEAIRLEPNYVDTYFNRALAYEKINDFDRAIADYDKVIQLDSKDKMAINSRDKLIANREAPAQAQALLASITPEPVKDEDFEVSQNRDNTITITGYKGTAKNVVIPDTLWGLKVTSIGKRAFQNKGLISVVIPDTVITIENGESGNYTLADQNVGAFYNNGGLIKVTLGKSIETIGDFAFAKCHITEIIIPNSVTRIGDYSFAYTGLTKATFGTGLKTIGKGAFYNSANYMDYSNSNDNHIAEVILPSSLKEIGDYAFTNAGIQTLELGSGLQTIGERAFGYNKIQKVTLGTDLQTIGEEAFLSNQITEINFTLPSSLKRIVYGTFADNQIQSITIPNSITEISSSRWMSQSYTVQYKGAFASNPLTTVVIPASLVNGRIESQSFGSTNGNTITRITIPAGMNEGTLKGLFEDAFVNFWINQSRAGGTYVKRGPIWTKE